MIALHTTIAIAAIILLIIRAKVDPIIALVLGCLYLGLASGIGFEKTVDAITSGFGDIMAKIGLLIGFGVLMGALLHRVGAFKVMVEALVRVVPANRLPYALAMALATTPRRSMSMSRLCSPLPWPARPRSSSARTASPGCPAPSGPASSAATFSSSLAWPPSRLPVC